MNKNDYIKSVEKIELSADFYERTEKKMLEAAENTSRKKPTKIINIAKISAMAAGFALLCAWTLIAVTGNNFKLTTETADNSVDAVAAETDATMAAAETVHDLLTDDMQGAPLMPDGMIEDEAVENDEPSYVNGEPYEEVTSPAYDPNTAVDNVGAQTAVEKEFPINRFDATTTMVTEPVDVDGKVQSTMEPTVDNVPVATMPVAYHEPIITECGQNGKFVVIDYKNNSGEELTTGYDYFFYKVEKGKPVMQSVTYIEIALILPHGADVTIKIDTSELSDGEYIVKKMFPDVDYTSEVSFRIENGVLIFPGK
ncbi:MAG: hypothetical protein IKL70_06830 [Oscillospiraceae bacterium]|nr:hypothetical protein [Oscillospiraceae bacterium]